ncbi:flagellar hook-associated protein FlgL [Halalkalibacter nanhaiisediminis]|uniref:Flagellar hook-associated protein 3 FlgL n=1 Tax=Halalkalibacter nanhaiisediminis TaxID=688079 RepID=A0A562QTB6_9BACI|nr:flagellar hook-associated protein FlgL [Halalkalibacter nanhaiisediminis]TWI59947.1 flagellar hook-associated protein 3 FlgL [Halalkalibacter nanhaiisediminis]
MRVTQTMLANSSLSHINQGYNRLATIQDQLATGKKITRASQDPVVAMKGMRYRTQVTEVEQFKRNLGEAYNWMDTADAALDQGTETLRRIREIATQAANDSYNAGERANMAKEVQQLREHLQSLGNTKNSNKYIFNGTDTTKPPVIDINSMEYGVDKLFATGTDFNAIEVVYDGKIFKQVGIEGNKQIFQDVSQTSPVYGEADFDDKAVQLIVQEGGRVTFSEPNRAYNSNDPTSEKAVKKDVRSQDVIVADKGAVSINTQTVEIELLKGVTIPVSINPSNVFNNALFGDILRLEQALKDPTVNGKDLTGYIDNMFTHIDSFVAERAELGARVNRVQMMENRLMEQEVTANRIMSDNEDADLEQVIIDLTIQESVHRAALAVGARIVQPSLMDFLR